MLEKISAQHYAMLTTYLTFSDVQTFLCPWEGRDSVYLSAPFRIARIHRRSLPTFLVLLLSPLLRFLTMFELPKFANGKLLLRSLEYLITQILKYNLQMRVSIFFDIYLKIVWGCYNYLNSVVLRTK